MVDFNALLAKNNAIKTAADRFVAWRHANAAQLQGAPTPPSEEYAAMLKRVDKESPNRLDWPKFAAMPEHEFLAEFSGILRHVNDDGTLRRGYEPGFIDG